MMPAPSAARIISRLTSKRNRASAAKEERTANQPPAAPERMNAAWCQAAGRPARSSTMPSASSERHAPVSTAIAIPFAKCSSSAADIFAPHGLERASGRLSSALSAGTCRRESPTRPVSAVTRNSFAASAGTRPRRRAHSSQVPSDWRRSQYVTRCANSAPTSSASALRSSGATSVG